MRVVFDVNVYLSNILDDASAWPEIERVPPASASACADCLSIAFDGVDVSLYLSPHILQNIIRVLKETGHTEGFIARYVAALIDIIDMSGGEVLDPPPRDHGVRDYEDNLILNLMLIADADVLVTEDTDLTQLKTWNGRAILRQHEFVNRYVQSRRHQR